MANISNLLNQIKTAIKGEDVRGAIHDAIEQCYTDGQWDVQVGSSGHGLVDKLARDKIDQYISGSTGQMNEVRLYPLPGDTDPIYCEMPFTLKEDPLEYDLIRVYYKVVATSNEQIFQFKSSQFAADPTVITGCYFKKEDETLKVKRINIKHTEDSPAQNPTSYIAYDVGIWSWSGAAADPATSYEVDGVSIDQSDPYPAGQITKITGIRFTTVEEATGNIIGDKSNLTTDDTTNLVAAINEVNAGTSELENNAVRFKRYLTSSDDLLALPIGVYGISVASADKPSNMPGDFSAINNGYIAVFESESSSTKFALCVEAYTKRIWLWSGYEWTEISKLGDVENEIGESELSVYQYISENLFPDISLMGNDYVAKETQVSTTNTQYRFIDPTGVKEVSSSYSDWWVSNDIEISPCTFYYVTASARSADHHLYQFLDENDNILGYESATTWDIVSITDKLVYSPLKAAKIRIASVNGSSGIKLYNAVELSTSKPWAGLKWACVGDSLTAVNNTASVKYHDLIASKKGITVVNLGAGGTGYKKEYNGVAGFVDRTDSIPLDADVVTIFGSGNDNTYTIGNPTDSGTTTLCGCINTTIERILARVPTCKLGIITPTPWQAYNPSDDSNWMARYSDAIVQICKNRSIPWLDLYHCSNLRPWDSSFRETAYSNADGVHPNNIGHAMFAPKIESFLEDLLTESTYTEGLTEDIVDLKSAIETLLDVLNNESYSNALPVKRESVSIPTGNSNVAIPNDTSLVKTFTAGKKYFAYAEITIENLSGYVGGYMYLRWSYTTAQPVIQDMFAGTNAQLIKNGKIVLYGFFTSVAGDARPIIAPMNTSAAYSCDITLNKLFLFETDKDLHEACANSENVNQLYLQKETEVTVTYDSLSADLQKQIPSTESVVVDCWGDSLTQGAGSTNYPYPTKLQSLLGDGYTVNNYGQGSETAENVAFRQGGLSAIVDPFTFNTGDTTKDITAKFINGAGLGNLNISGLYHGDGRVYIDNNPFMFRRAAGDRFYVALQGDTSSVHSYSRPQLMVAEGKGTGHIALICIGQNGWIDDDANTLADIIEGMVRHNNHTQYLILGRPTGSTSLRSAEESVIASRFNEHFVNLREYISQYGLADNNLTATTADTDAMAIGAIPPQLLTDGVHLNDYGYIAMANCIYQRGKTLGYWS